MSNYYLFYYTSPKQLSGYPCKTHIRTPLASTCCGLVL